MEIIELYFFYIFHGLKSLGDSFAQPFEFPVFIDHFLDKDVGEPFFLPEQIFNRFLVFLLALIFDNPVDEIEDSRSKFMKK